MNEERRKMIGLTAGLIDDLGIKIKSLEIKKRQAEKQLEILSSDLSDEEANIKSNECITDYLLNEAPTEEKLGILKMVVESLTKKHQAKES